MVPEASSVKGGSLIMWKELRNGVFKEGLAEWPGRFKENCKSRRKMVQVALLGMSQAPRTSS